MDESHLIKKWLSGALTEAESKAFEAWHDSKFSKEILDSAKHFKASQFTKAENFQSFKTKRESLKKESGSLVGLHTFLKIAAIVIISLGVYFTAFHNHNTVLETAVAEKKSIELPDRSTVTLNALSSIMFNANDWHNTREVKLEGEAFFKVAKGQKFDVVTTQGIVTVVGTEFNVKDRPDYFEVICFEGVVKVAFDTISKDLQAGDAFLMLNGNLVFDNTKAIAPSWKSNASEFKAIPVKEVFAEIERQYAIKINVTNIDGNRLFTGGFPHDSLEKALQSVTIPMHMTFEKNTSDVVIIHEGKD